MDIHIKAIETICRICGSKKKSENLRPLDSNEERKNLIQTQYQINIEEEKSFCWFPQRICTGCCGSLKRSLDNECYKIPPEKICNVSRRLTDGHDPNTCDICQIYQGQSGKATKSVKLSQSCSAILASQTDQHEPSMFSRKELWNKQPVRCHNCFTTAIVGHQCNRRNAIENAAQMLEDLGIADEVNTNFVHFRIIIYTYST